MNEAPGAIVEAPATVEGSATDPSMALFASELARVSGLGSSEEAIELCTAVGIAVEPGQLSLEAMQRLLREYYDSTARRLQADAGSAATTVATYLEAGKIPAALDTARQCLARYPWHERLRGLAAEAEARATAERGPEDLEAPREGAAPPPPYSAAPPTEGSVEAPSEFHVRPVTVLEGASKADQIADTALLEAFSASPSGPPATNLEGGLQQLSRKTSEEFRMAQIERDDQMLRERVAAAANAAPPLEGEPPPARSEAAPDPQIEAKNEALLAEEAQEGVVEAEELERDQLALPTSGLDVNLTPDPAGSTSGNSISMTVVNMTPQTLMLYYYWKGALAKQGVRITSGESTKANTDGGVKWRICEAGATDAQAREWTLDELQGMNQTFTISTNDPADADGSSQIAVDALGRADSRARGTPLLKVRATHTKSTRADGTLDFQRGETLIIIDNSGVNWWTAYHQSDPEHIAKIPVNYVEVIEILDPGLKAREAERQAAIAEAEEAARRESEEAEAQRQAEAEKQAQSISDDQLLSECADFVRQERLIPQHLLKEQQRRAGSSAQPPLWKTLGLYSSAMQYGSQQDSGTGLSAEAKRINDNLARQCRDTIMREVYQQEETSARSPLNPLLPEVTQKSFSMFATKRSFTFYAVSPFLPGPLPLGARLMVLGNHEHLGFVPGKIGREEKSSPLLEFDTSGDNALLEATIDLPEPTESDIYHRRDRREWFSWKVVLVIGNSFVHDMGSTSAGQSVSYTANVALAENLVFPCTKLPGVEPAQQVQLLLQSKVLSETQSPVELIMAHSYRQLMTAEQPNVVAALDSHKTMLATRRQGCITGGVYSSLLQELVDASASDRATTQRERQALGFVYLLQVAGKELDQGVVPANATLGLLMRAAVVLVPAAAWTHIPVDLYKPLCVKLGAVISRAMRASEISWLRAIPALNSAEKKFGTKNLPDMPLIATSIARPREEEYLNELRFIGDNDLLVEDSKMNALLSKRRFPLGYWAGLANPGSMQSVITLLQIRAGDGKPTDEHISGTVSALFGDTQFLMNTLAHDQAMEDLINQIEHSGRLEATRDVVGSLFQHLARQVHDDRTAARFMERIRTLIDRVDMTKCMLGILRSTGVDFGSTDLSDLTNLLINVYSTKHGKALSRADRHDHGQAIRSLIDQRRRRYLSNVHILRSLSKLANVSWLTEPVAQTLKGLLVGHFDLEQIQGLIHDLPFDGIHADIAKCVWDHCLVLLEPDDPALLNDALEGFAQVAMRWTRGTSEGVVLKVTKAFFDESMACDLLDNHFLEPGELVTVATEEFSSTPTGDDATWTGLVRGCTATVPRDCLAEADEGQYEGRKNVQHCLAMLGQLSGRLLGFLNNRHVAVEELLSDSALKFISLQRELAASDKFGESRKSKAFFDAMSKLTTILETRSQSLRDESVNVRDLQTMLSPRYREQALSLFGAALKDASSGDDRHVAELFQAADSKLQEANKAKDAMASLHRFLDTLRQQVDPQLMMIIKEFEVLQSSWATRTLRELGGSAVLAVVKPNEQVMSQLKTMQQSTTLFPMLKQHLVESVVMKWGTPAGAHNLEVFVGKVDSEYVKGNADDDDAALWFRAVTTAQVRAGVELDSETCGQLSAGEVVRIEEEADTQGIRRLRSRYGWTSAVSSDGTRILEELENVVAKQTGKIFVGAEGDSQVGVVAPGVTFVVLESHPQWKTASDRVLVQSVTGEGSAKGWVAPELLLGNGSDGKSGGLLSGIIGAVKGARSTTDELNMSQTFMTDGIIQVSDVFTWMLPQLVASWFRVYTQLFSLTIALPRIDDVLGKSLAHRPDTLAHELGVLADTAKIESGQQLAETDTVVRYVGKYTRVAEAKRFLWSLLGIVDNLKIKTSGDQQFEACKNTELELRTDWQQGTLRDVDDLQVKIDKVIGSLDDQHREFLSIVGGSSKIISIILTGLPSDQFTYLKDDETMRAMTQRVLDNQEFSATETSAVTALTNIRWLLGGVLGPHASFSAFMDTVRDFALVPDHLTLFKSLEPTVRAVERVFKSLNVRVGAKDTALLEQILTTATWRFTQPLSVRGEPEALARDTVKVEVGDTSMSLGDAAGLRDRLYLEIDENAEDEASLKQAHNIDTFHRTVEAVSEYNIILVKLFLKGHRESGNTYNKTIAAGMEAEDINVLRDRSTNSLRKWEKGVSDLRDGCPAMNYFTVHQLMLISDDLQSDVVPYHMLRFARPVPDGSIPKQMILEHYTNNLEGGKSTSGRELAKQFSVVSVRGLRLLEAVGTFLTEVFSQHDNGYRLIEGADDIPPVEISSKELNLVVAPSPNQVLSTLLAVYAKLGRVPLASECLFCSASTTLEEVLLLVRRCFDAAKMEMDAPGGSPQHRSTLVNADQLPHALQQEIIMHINLKVRAAGVLQENAFQLVILCGEPRCLFADSYRRLERLVSPLDSESESRLIRSIFPVSWSKDQPYPYVKVFTADKVGVGKTFNLKREAKRDHAQLGLGSGDSITSVPLSNQSETADAILPYLRAEQSPHPHAFHINVAATCSSYCDYLIFQIVVCGDLVDKHGEHYSPAPRDAFYIELPSELNLATRGVPLTDTLQFCMSLPSRHITMATDQLECTLPDVQLVAKYLNALMHNRLNGAAGANFIASQTPRLGDAEVLEALRIYAPTVTVYDSTAADHFVDSSVLDESMILTMTFVRFLHSMVHTIDTVFMNASWGGMLGNEQLNAMGKPDFKEKLVHSLIQTSKEYAGRTISPHSLLPEQALAMGLRVEGGSKAFGLMASWMLRPMILPTPRSTYELLCLDPSTVPEDIINYWSSGFKGISGFKFNDYRHVSKSEAQNLLMRLSGVTAPGPDVDRKFSSFVLTIDNILKMVAVYFRAEAGISVVIMGETGCGKTFSISYLAAFLSIPFFKLDVHGGIGETDVKEFMEEAIVQAATNPRVWVFLDEVNTCDALGLFKEMICDHTMDGKPLPDNLTVLAACNPYRIRPKSMGRTGGLSVPSDDDDGAMRSDLVYVVHPLPETLLDYVWDYGTLNKDEEKRYIASMLKTEFPKMTPTGLKKQDENHFVDLFADTVVSAHEFLRVCYDGEVSVVSLRDVARCIKLFAWFKDSGSKIKTIGRSKKRVYSDNRTIAAEAALESMVLAVCHCYHFRLKEDPDPGERGRTDFKEELAKIAGRSAFVVGQSVELQRQITAVWYDTTLNMMMGMYMKALGDLPAGIAPNAALRENIFMMVVCIMNRVPLIVVGKPGSSKTLAMQLIRDAFSRSTKAPLFDECDFNDLEMFPYQCSKHATADEIENRFKSAKKFQDADVNGTLSSVVFLDEVGLAEESKAMPLKVLHKLLEKPEVAFVGLSNWDLDPAKMNRAVYLLRPDAKPEDLSTTAVEIVKGGRKEANHVLEAIMRSLTNAYLDVDKKQAARGYGLRGGGHFIGLRDFYNFVKLLDRQIRSSRDGVLTARMLCECVFRSFGGFRNSDIVPIVAEAFYNHCPVLENAVERPEELLSVVSRLDLIKANLQDLPTDTEQGARHLMVLSEHESALQVLLDKRIVDLSSSTIIYGSHFAEDRSNLTMYRTISTIKNCMEAGHTVVLLHLDEIYESLYDMLNQAYTKGVAGGLFCRLAIGARSRQCEVHKSFRCIVVVDSERAYSQLPSPLLNRFEKQCLSRSDVLEGNFKKAEPVVWDWCRGIAKTITAESPPTDIDLISADTSGLTKVLSTVFVGFNSETVASVLLSLQERGGGTVISSEAEAAKAATELRTEIAQLKPSTLRSRAKAALDPAMFSMAQSDDQKLAMFLATDGTQARIVAHQVMEQLVQCATPEIVVKYAWVTGRGLDGTRASDPSSPQAYTNMAQIYFEHQTHSSLWDYICAGASTSHDVQATVMTFSEPTVDLINQPHLQPSAGEQLPAGLNGVTWDVWQLASFARSNEFSGKLDEFFRTEQSSGLVIQCGLGRTTTGTTVTGAQIHHAKSMVGACRRMAAVDSQCVKHVVFVVHLVKDQSAEGVIVPFAFHAEREWTYVVIDSVEKPDVQGIPLVQSMLIPSIEELFGVDMGASGNALTQAVLQSSLRRCLSRLVYPPENRRDVTIQQRLTLLQSVLDDTDFIRSVMARVHAVFSQSAKEQMQDGWQGTMERGEVAGAGSYRKALFKRVEGSVTEGFTRLLAAVDGCDNLRLYSKLTEMVNSARATSSQARRGSLSATPRMVSDMSAWSQLRSVWLRLAEDESLVPLPPVHQRNQCFEIATPLRSKSYKSQYPFSMQLAPKIEGLREVAVELAHGAGRIDDVWDRLVELVRMSSMGFAADVGVLAYLEDFAHLRMPPTISEWDEASTDLDAEASMLRLIKAVILRRAMDKTGRSRDECLQNIADVHSAYAEVKELLRQTGDLIQLIPADVATPLLDKMGGCLRADQSGVISRDGLVTMVLLVLKAALKSLNPSYALTPTEERRREESGQKETWGEWMGGLWSSPEMDSQQVLEGYVQQVSLMNAYVEYLVDWTKTYTLMSGEDEIENPLADLDGNFGEARTLPLGDLVDVQHHGWLTKQGHVIKSWRRRWCVVSIFQGQRFLHYYDSDTDLKAPPLGMIHLENPEVKLKADKTGAAFELITENSKHEGGHTHIAMRGETPAERDLWMRALSPQTYDGGAEDASIDQVDEARALDALESLRQSTLVDTHSYMFRTYPNSFIASTAVDWLVEGLYASSKVDAVAMGNVWVRLGMVAHATDSSLDFQNKNQYYHLVGDLLDEPGWEGVVAPTGDNQHEETLRKLNADWRRTRVFSECVTLVLLPIHATLDAGKSVWQLLESSSDLGSLTLLKDAVVLFTKAECDKKFGSTVMKNDACARFGQRYLADHVLLQRPRMSTLKFVIKVCAYEGNRGYEKEVDAFLVPKKRSATPAVTAATRTNLMRLLLQFVTLEDDHDPMRVGIEARALKMIHRAQHGDNVLNLILSQVVQDRMTAEMQDMSSEAKIRQVASHGGSAESTVIELSAKGFNEVSTNAFDSNNIMDWMIAVAQTRLVVEFTAEMMLSDHAGRLNDVARGLCRECLYPICSRLLDMGIVPGQSRVLQIYLFKQLDRRMGLQAAVQFLTTDLPQITPLFTMSALEQEFTTMGLEGSSIMPTLDPFEHFHRGTGYASLAQGLRRCIAVGDPARDTDLFRPIQEDVGNTDISVVVSAVFREVYLRHGGSDAKPPTDLEWLLEGCDKQKASPDLKEFNEKLATNVFDHGSTFHLNSATSLADVCMLRPLIHLATGVLAMGGTATFFKQLLVDPGSFVDQFVPTMPEDELAAILATQGDVGIYYCQNGHPYLVGNCTRPDQAGRCTCGAPIGNAKGKSAHTMESGNRFGGWTKAGAHRLNNKWANSMVDSKGNRVDIKDLAKQAGGVHEDEDAPRGYSLNDSTTERDKFTSCRALTPTSTRVIRFLLHGMLALAHASDLRGSSSASCDRLKQGFTSADFCNHMENDFRILTELLSRSAEDVSFTLHLIVEKYLKASANREDASFGSGLTKDRRRSFEDFFHAACIVPVLQESEQLQTIKAGCDVSTDPTTKRLSAEVTETDEFERYNTASSRASLTPLLLRYRCPITYDLFVRSFDVEPELEQRYPIIHAFLSSERELRVVRHIFDIYRFQELVFKTYSRRIGRQEAQETTVAQAIDAIKDSNVQKEWRTAFKAFIQAWNAVAPHVKRFECDENYRLPRLEGDFDRVMLPQRPIHTDMELPIDLAMPNRSREEYVNSIAPVALLQWSTRLHNGFVEGARTSMITELQMGAEATRVRKVTQDQAAKVMQQGAPVPTHMLRRSDCISYDFDKFVAFVCSQTSQSLEYGRGGEMAFNWAAIQQWIIDHVLGGVPTLQDGIRSFEFRGEGMGLMNQVGNVPQTSLDPKLIAVVMAEQQTLQKIQRLQERLREVMGFLRSTGGNPNTLVSTYAAGVLQLTDTEMADLQASDGSAGAVMGMVKLQHLAALDTALSRELRDPLESVSSQYCDALPSDQAALIKRSAADMGPQNAELMVKAWLQMIEQYCTDYQEPYPPTSNLKETLAWMPTVDSDEVLIELEWFESLFPEELLLANMCPALKLYRQLATAALATAAPPAGQQPLEMEPEPEPEGVWEMEPEPEPEPYVPVAKVTPVLEA